jgi:hypothetical protein
VTDTRKEPSLESAIQQHHLMLTMLANAAATVAIFDLQQVLRQMETADAFGHMLDPTLYRNNVQKMREDQQLVEAAFPLWKWAKRAEAEFIKSHTAGSG